MGYVASHLKVTDLNLTLIISNVVKLSKYQRETVNDSEIGWIRSEKVYSLTTCQAQSLPEDFLLHYFI